MLAVLASAVLIQAPGYAAGKYEFGERYRALDVAWSQCDDKARKLQSLPNIDKAMAAFRASQFGDGCRALDEARAALYGSRVVTGDAMSLRFAPSFIEPGAKASLKVNWAYAPSELKPVALSVGGRNVSVIPGRTLTLQIDPATSNAELRINPEQGYLMPATIDSAPRTAFVSIIKHARERITALKESKNMASRWLAVRLEQAIAKPQNEWQETPVIEWLFLAERLDGGQLLLDRVQEMPYVQHRGSIFRVALPLSQSLRSGERLTNVVIAFGGSIGQEDSWFEFFGRGQAASEALQRDWVFISVRPDLRAYENALDWITRVRHVKLLETFVIAHGEGASLAIESANRSKIPRGFALFAPELKGGAGELPKMPTHIITGKQDPLLKQDWLEQAHNRASLKTLEFFEPDACNHQMVISDGIINAYGFFDKMLGP